jgi:hypothetical protein
MEIFLLPENTTLSVAICKRQYLTDCAGQPGAFTGRFAAYAQGMAVREEVCCGRSCFLEKCKYFTMMA